MKIVLIVVALAIVGIVSFVFYKRQKFPSGIVIVLNGPSGSGKTSIQKEFQKLMMPNLWIKLGIDNLFDNPMPEITRENMAYWQSPNAIRWVESTQDTQGNKVITLFVGQQGEKVVCGMHDAIAQYAHNGCNCIVDYIAYKHEWLHDLQRKLAHVKTYYVAVDIPLETLEQREEARGTSPKGHARSHYFTVHGDFKYDLRVDTSKDTAAEIAQQLKKMIEQ